MSKDWQKKTEIFNDQNTKLESLQDPLLISQFLGRVGEHIRLLPGYCSRWYHVASGVLEPEFFDHSQQLGTAIRIPA
jgi:hypothetical protein